MGSQTRGAFLVVALTLVPLLGAQTAVAAGTHSKTTGLCAFDRDSLWTPSGSCQPRARVYPKNVTGKVRHAIYDSALVFGVPYFVLLQIAKCESGLNPRARSGPYKGLFQFLSDTFQRGAKSMRSLTGIKAASPWKPLDASYVAGFLFAIGQSKQWGCEHLRR